MKCSAWDVRTFSLNDGIIEWNEAMSTFYFPKPLLVVLGQISKKIPKY